MKVTTIYFDGPVIKARKCRAFIRITRHRVTSTVRWDVGTIDNIAAASDAFSNRLQALEMLETVSKWFRGNLKEFTYRAGLFGCVRWGRVCFIPHDHADRLAKLVSGFFMEAARDLPTEYL